MSHPAPVHFRAAGVSLVISLEGPVPAVLHWGADLGELDENGLRALALSTPTETPHNAPDLPRRLTLLPTERDLWVGTPGLSGHLGGRRTSPRPVIEDGSTRLSHDADLGSTLEVQLSDEVTGLEFGLLVRLTPQGLVQVRHRVLRPADDQDPELPYELSAVTALMPLPPRASEILDFTGRWARERQPQRLPVVDGSHHRHMRRGKPGPDSPYLTLAGTPSFGNRTGEVWGFHLAWSGESHWRVERLPEGAGGSTSVIGGGEALRPGEVRLAPGQEYVSPDAFFAWSGRGLDGISDRFHQYLRARSSHPVRPRPVIVNTWEAVYFDHSLDRLKALVDKAAEVGAERFVLDDGWFLGRRNDTTSLGDWQVDPKVWPEGLAPLADHVRERGLEFGLWFEPEMISLDSEAARRHPDWILAPSQGQGAPMRQQYVLDLTNPEAFAYLVDAISNAVTAFGVAYIKWDHNRELHEAVSRGHGDAVAVSAQTRATYALMDTLRERHPGLEIESCASGGARVDLGILARTDRVWASDCIDPVERVMIDRWTMQLLPPELVGVHVGSSPAHTTSRDTGATLRFAGALIGHAGVEWDLTSRSAEELAALQRFIAFHKSVRPMIARGQVVNADVADPATTLRGMVDTDAARAVYIWARTTTSASVFSGQVQFPGLDPARTYAVRVVGDFGLPSFAGRFHSAWVQQAVDGELLLPGSVLTTVGLPMPTLSAQQALVLELNAR
ncbi:alpha-galactosidase [Kineosporia sp. NBRC 101677]|uniref:alpha-galactosidase n=1 Tax=Kineosporia sp. NBRC 101677 TaxID=3032197 RepID=UPI0024A5E679|nr:alpha-galactosidase [Kineosporia sp. NBRC 101677]GLY15137.1 alpha-galactosidase [Kineosporia sp. NBRC 101677]